MPSDKLLMKRIGQEFACVGEWWVPGVHDPTNPKRMHTGTLTFARGKGIVLDVMGQFENKELSESPSPFPDRSYEMIWGKSAEGELITLHNCQWAGGSIGSKSSASYSIREVFASTDIWFTPHEEIAFKFLDLEFTLLDEWIGEYAIRRHTEFVDGKMKVDITAEAIDKLPSITVGDYVISTYVGVGVQGTRVPTRKETVEQAAVFHIESRASTEISLDEVHELTRGLQNFLSLLMYDEPIYPLVINGALTVTVDGDRARTAIARLLYEPIGTKKTSDRLGNILFSLKDVEDVWEDALREMIMAEEDKLKLVFNQFFAEHYSPSPFVEDRFMATMRTIEAFHRRTCTKDFYMEKTEYQTELLGKLLKPVTGAHLDSSFNDSLKNRLEYGYQYSLRKRLNELLDSPNGEEFLTLFVASDEEKENLKMEMQALETEIEQKKEQKRQQWIKKQRETFVETTVKTRNWYTHFDVDDKLRAMTDAPELEFLNRKLRLFTAALLLGYVHVPLDKVRSKFQHSKFSYLAGN